LHSLVQTVEAAEGAAEIEEGLVEVLAPLVADRRPSARGKPGHRALHDPAAAAQPGRVLDALGAMRTPMPRRARKRRQRRASYPLSACRFSGRLRRRPFACLTAGMAATSAAKMVASGRAARSTCTGS